LGWLVGYWLFVCLFVGWFFVCLFVGLLVGCWLAGWLCVCWVFVCLCVCLSVGWLVGWLAVCLFVCVFVCLLVGCWLVGCLFVCLSVGCWLVGWCLLFPQVVSRGYPAAMGEFFQKEIDQLKEQVLTYQKAYAAYVVVTESALSMQDADSSVVAMDRQVSELTGLTEAFKKAKGKDIKSLSS